MPGINRDIIEEKIPLYPNIKAVKEKLRGKKPDWALMIKEEVSKQWEEGFINVTQHPNGLEMLCQFQRRMKE